jgi:hypothetical protein
MSFERQSTLINPPSVVTYKPQSRIGLIVGIIILVVVVIMLLVLVIILLVRKPKTAQPECTTNANCTGGKLCSNGSCVTCTSPPSRPSTVNSSYDPLTGEATITWSPVDRANSYNVYRKLEDPSVNVNNYSQREGTSGTSRLFTSLETGTHYFVVTAVNDCGESQPSSPVVLAPSCSSLAGTMAAPTVTQTLNDCAGPTTSDQVSISFANTSIPNGVYVVQGSGQAGVVDPYLYLVYGSSYGPTAPIYLKCGGVATNHYVSQITDVKNAPLTVSGPPVAGTTFTMTWKPVAGSERYLVFLVGVNGAGVAHYYGSFAEAHETSLTLQTNSGDTLVFGLVLGYRICDQSTASPVTPYVTAP